MGVSRHEQPSGQAVDPTQQFWSNDELVAAYTVGTALDYEIDAVRSATAAARRTGEVRTVHVLGVGAGRELAAVRAETGAELVHAWDISEPMVGACRERVAAEGWSDVRVGRAAVDELAPPDGVRADVVVALGAVLGYGTRPDTRRRSLDTVAGLLRPGGTLVAVVQQRNGRLDWAIYFAVRDLWRAASGSRRSTGNRRSRHGASSVEFHHYTVNELEQLLSASGFAAVEISSLRAWARARGNPLPRRSPNPLIVLATRS